ncbi:Mov34/MPN/PAD-1 family protein [Reyranella sp.]|uniref:Mov34/MPN/PAD-1 family protein n=1 Tax=Reyranella sp. TaxID=1929291 RepID=UPI0027288139|nr:Mov34/MPN/PAD-1 family protein [Reyranella sp.]MDO8975878.1 Mov34/MPN/PAD-1 family protein [Reyranella sp.]
MKLLLPRSVLNRLRHDLKGGKRREIGGLILGEHVEGETFRIVELTVQKTGSSPVHFIRDPSFHQPQLDDFFARTGNDYARFNYMGEWHSHPSFEPLPSTEDIMSMQEIVEDSTVGVNFLVLVIARLIRLDNIQLSAMLFQPHYPPSEIDAVLEDAADQKVSLVRRFFRSVFNRAT